MVNQALWNIEAKMQKTVEGLKQELAAIRTGRATPTLIEHIKIDYAGFPTPLNQVAGISVPEARLLVIQPWDKGSIRSIEKAILTSDLGLNPVNDGNVIRINIPPLSEERRRELIKIVKRRIEEGRIAIRNHRHNAINELKKLENDKQISQDEHKRTLAKLQKITDSFIGNAEQVGRDKETELMQV